MRRASAATMPGAPGGTRRPARRQPRAAPKPRGTRGARAASCFRGTGSRSGRASSYCTRVFRRKRFGEVIERQLALFEEEDSDLLDDVDLALDKYNRADRDEAEELYGDYQLAIEAATDRLAEFRDAYARTLEEDDAEQYVQEFNRGVIDRWRALAPTIEES